MSLLEDRQVKLARVALRRRVRVLVRQVLSENESLSMDNDGDRVRLERALVDRLVP